MKSASLALAALAAASLGVFAWLAFDDAPGRSVEAARRTASTEASTQARATAIDARPDEIAVERAASETSAVESESALQAQAPGPAVRRNVRVLEQASAEPVAGARVHYGAVRGESSQSDHAAWRPAQVGDWLTRAPYVECDSDGRASFETSPEWDYVVIATAPARIARAVLERSESAQTEELTLELLPDGSFSVEALGFDGAPLVDAPVGLMSIHSFGASVLLEQRTDARGRTRFEHIGLTLGRGAGRIGFRLVGLLGPDAEHVLEHIDADEERIVLRAPAFGSVELSVFDAVGEPLTRGAGVLTVLGPDEDPNALRSMFARSESAHAQVVDGRVLFPSVRLNERVLFECTPEGSSSSARTHFDGPRSPGELVSHVLRIADALPIVKLRLLDAQGAALKETEIEARVEERMRGARNVSSSNPRTDEHGVCLLIIANSTGADLQRTLFLRLERGNAPPVDAQIALPDRLAPGVNDLGDVALTLAPLACAGRVMQADGTAAAGAELSLRIDDDEDRAWGSTSLSAVSDTEGAFEFRSRANCSSMALEAKWNDARAVEKQLPCGASQVVLTVRRGGELAGRVIADPGLRFDALLVRAVKAGAGQNNTQPKRLGPAGAFSQASLESGYYSLIVESSGSSTELVRLDDLFVPEGARCADPRLEAIDLRGRVRTVRIELVGASAGEPIRGELRAVSEEFPEDSSAQFLSTGETSLAFRGDSIDLEIEVPGYRLVRLEKVREDQRIQLQRGPRVRLRLPPESPLPKPPVHLKAQLVPSGGSSSIAGHFQPEVFGPNGEMALHAPGPGTFEVHWLIETRTAQSLSTSSVTVSEPQRITLADSDVEQIVELSLPPEVVAQLPQK